jgi:hypothetical protein
MSTQAPAQITSFPDTSIEKIAYKSVETIPTHEPNGRNRLGYHIWRWLKEKKGTLEEAIQTANVPLLITQKDAVKRVRESLRQYELLK